VVGILLLLHLLLAALYYVCRKSPYLSNTLHEVLPEALVYEVRWAIHLRGWHPTASEAGTLLHLRLAVTGAPYREVNSKVATAPKLKVEDKDRVNNSQTSAKNYPASDTAPLHPDARDVESASPASCAS